MIRRAWHARLAASRLAIVKARRQAGQRMHKVAAQGITRARMTGAKLARHIVSVQKAAALDPRLIRESLRSVAFRPMTRDGDKAWQWGYAETAVRMLNPARPGKAAAGSTGPAAARRGSAGDASVGQGGRMTAIDLPPSPPCAHGTARRPTCRFCARQWYRRLVAARQGHCAASFRQGAGKTGDQIDIEAGGREAG